MISSILSAYGLADGSDVEPLVSGLINRTWKVTQGGNAYILQRINDSVFKKPYELAENIDRVGAYLALHNPGYLFVTPIKSKEKMGIVEQEGGYYRLFPFVRGSHTINVVSTPDQAFEAALQFGKFTRLLSGFDAGSLHTTIPDFHNLSLRYRQFEDAISVGSPERIKASTTIISEIKKHAHILSTFEKLQTSDFVRRRVTHHDTKISNVLFDHNGKGICVIDLDTVMPGYFISDVGDMLRTYLSPASEEEKDFSNIEIRDEFFKAIVQGYLSNMGDELSTEEKDLILYAGFFLIFMQAIRFLADYCNNDAYYGASYDDHNLIRAGNQVVLLKRLEEKSVLFTEIIAKELNATHYIK